MTISPAAHSAVRQANFAHSWAQTRERVSQMPGSAIATVMLMVFIVMAALSFWRQILIFMFYVGITVFCFGIYYIARTITLII